ncbi:MAG: GtrA family protein [Bacteroidota bacterium]
MNKWLKWAYQFVAEKIPFAMTGAVATAVNFGVYLLLVDRVLPYLPATMIAYASGVLLNFVLHRYFVFDLNRSVSGALGLTLATSGIGLLLDAFIVFVLHRTNVLGDSEPLIKITTMGILFFYNFYSKRYAFEGRKTSRSKESNN